MIKKLYGKWYSLRILHCKLDDSGHTGATRNRIYLILFWKETVVEEYSVVDMYAEVTAYIKQYVSTQPKDYLIADRIDVLLEAELTALRRKKKLKPLTDEPDLTYLLNFREKEQIRRAKKCFLKKTGRQAESNKNLMLFLGDNFTERRKTWSLVSQRIPTLRMNTGKIWVFHKKRWLCGREKLASLGFPVTPGLAEAMGVPVLPVTDAQRASSLSGSCMALTTVAIVELVALSSLRLKLPDVRTN